MPFSEVSLRTICFHSRTIRFSQQQRSENVEYTNANVIISELTIRDLNSLTYIALHMELDEYIWKYDENNKILGVEKSVR